MFKHRISFLLLIVIVLAVLALVSHGKDGDETNAAESAAQFVFSPLQSGTTYVFEGLGNLWKRYIALSDAAQRAEEAMAAKHRMELELQSLRAAEKENIRLKRLLQFKEAHKLEAIGANVVAVDLFGAYRSITIDRGRRDGISSKAVVVNEHGVVGRIWKLFGSSAQVLLMTDPNSAIDSLVERNRAQGMVQGLPGRDKLQCQIVYSLRTTGVHEGDLVVTSGMDSRFPAGLPMGTVAELSQQREGIFIEAVLEPAVDFTRLEEVLVLEPTGGL